MIEIWLGGLHIRLTAGKISFPAPTLAPAYQSFLLKPDFAGEISDRIDGRIISDRQPDLAGFDRIFDTERTWSLHRKGSGAYFFIHRPSGFEGRWIQAARFDIMRGELDVYEGPPEWPEEWRLPHPFQYPLDQMVSMYLLAARRGIIVHGAGAILDGQGCLFAGRSRAGKSTISGIIRDNLGADVLSDDRVIIRFDDAGVPWMYGTPWPGSAGIARNERVPLKHIFFLRHAKVNEAGGLAMSEAIERILPVVSVPWFDPEWSGAVLETCETVLNACGARLLDFTPDERAVQAVLSAISGIGQKG